MVADNGISCSASNGFCYDPSSQTTCGASEAHCGYPGYEYEDCDRTMTSSPPSPGDFQCGEASLLVITRNSNCSLQLLLIICGTPLSQLCHLLQNALFRAPMENTMGYREHVPHTTAIVHARPSRTAPLDQAVRKATTIHGAISVFVLPSLFETSLDSFYCTFVITPITLSKSTALVRGCDCARHVSYLLRSISRTCSRCGFGSNLATLHWHMQIDAI